MCRAARVVGYFAFLAPPASFAGFAPSFAPYVSAVSRALTPRAIRPRVSFSVL